MAIFEPFIALSVLPIIPFLLVYTICYVWKRDKKKSLLLAMDVTTLFFRLYNRRLKKSIINFDKIIIFLS